MQRKVRVILIEDDMGLREAIVMLLESAGYEVQPYLNTALFEHAGFPLADVYVIDRQLGVRDGLDLCRELKTAEATRQQRVVVISVNSNEEALAEEAGADAFLTKPFNKGELQTVLKRVLAY